MDKLKQKIISCGKALNSDVLLVDTFLNHLVDCELMNDIGLEFKRLFAGLGITKVATIESSGIAPACMTALHMGVPMIILKKSNSIILDGDVFQTEVFSFTKRSSYQLTLKKGYIEKGEKVLLIDDFMAKGEAAFGGARLIERSGATVAGIGAVISKNFQPGVERLREAGYIVKSLAPIARMDEGLIEFEEDDE